MTTLLRIILILFLTIISQTGGLVLLLAYSCQWKKPRQYGVWIYFTGLYVLAFLLTPVIAKPLGRVPLPVFATAEKPLQPQNLILVLANRHYVKPVVRDLALQAAVAFNKKHPTVKVTYLDANFPFFEGFPLLPHRSHDDGQKIDIAFVYQKSEELFTNAPAFMGYGRCEDPKPGEINQPKKCARQGYWQYNILKTLASPFTGNQYTFREKETAFLVQQFLKQKQVKKIFLEPHLKYRLGLGKASRIRFHGCGAVRHDDHFHVQIIGL